MSNLLQSSQTQATTAPGYYTNYLTDIANKTKAELDPTTGAQYVGPTALQDKAFKGVETAADSGDAQMQTAQSTLGTAVSSSSPLSAAQSYLTDATSNVGADATGLMSPYTSNVVNAIADAGQRNIMQNLAPQATAGAVGSGQFGSKRGAEVLGQTIQNANKDIMNQQYQALNAGYSDALKAALQQNQTEATVGRTAGDLASAGQQNLTQAGRAQGDLATAEQKMELEGINALSTLGEQERTLKQNEELFPLTNLSTAAGMLRGYNTPTTTTTTMEMSPLSAIIGAGTAGAGLLTANKDGVTPLDSLIKTAKGLVPKFGGIRTGSGSAEGTNPADDVMKALESQGYKLDPEGTGYMIKDGNYYALNGDNNPVLVGAVSVGVPEEVGPYEELKEPEGSDPYVPPEDNTELEEPPVEEELIEEDLYRGGAVGYADGGIAGGWSSSFAPHMNIGGLPTGGLPQYDQSNTYVGYNNTDGSFIPR